MERVSPLMVSWKGTGPGPTINDSCEEGVSPATSTPETPTAAAAIPAPLRKVRRETPSAGDSSFFRGNWILPPQRVVADGREPSGRRIVPSGDFPGRWQRRHAGVSSGKNGRLDSTIEDGAPGALAGEKFSLEKRWGKKRGPGATVATPGPHHRPWWGSGQAWCQESSSPGELELPVYRGPRGGRG